MSENASPVTAPTREQVKAIMVRALGAGAALLNASASQKGQAANILTNEILTLFEYPHIFATAVPPSPEPEVWTCCLCGKTKPSVAFGVSHTKYNDVDCAECLSKRIAKLLHHDQGEWRRSPIYSDDNATAVAPRREPTHAEIAETIDTYIHSRVPTKFATSLDAYISAHELADAIQALYRRQSNNGQPTG